MRLDPRAPTPVDEGSRPSVDRTMAPDLDRLRLVVENLPVVSYAIDRDGSREDVQWISGSIERLTGYTPQEWVADPDLWFRVVHPEDLEGAVALWKQTIDADMPCECEYRMVRRDGEELWVREKAVARMRDGMSHVDGIFEDVTERRFAQDRLADAEVRYRTRVEQLPLITYIGEVDPAPGDDTAFYTSPQIETILGYTNADYDEDPEGWRQMIHPEDRARINDAAARSESTGEPFVEEYRFLHKSDGHAVWVHDECVLLRRTDDGHPWLFQGVMYDITDRVKADTALQSSLARFQTLANDSPVGIFENDPDGSCTFVNDRWCEVTGMDPAPAMGSGWADAVHPEDRDSVFAGWAAAVAEDRDFLMEFRFVRPDGEVRWVTARAATVKDASGATTGFVSTIEDMTERRAVEERLRLIRAAVEHTGRAVLVASLGGGDRSTSSL